MTADRFQVDNQETKDFLNNVGCGFCLAKWTQVTIHLASGLTHSCHHVGAHKIPLEELKDNPSALHNTKEKKMRRKEMLAGKRPDECDYCWRIEDNTNEFSDRILKSASNWSQIDKDVIATSTGDEDIYPRAVEVSFSNVCNFKCAYCGPAFSSKWTEEIKAEGPYKLHQKPYNAIKTHEVPIPERDENPYIEAFWKWFPDAVTHMHTFRITGGEPLLSKHTFKVMDYLLENPQPKLNFAINTNGCPPDALWDKFLQKVKLLEDTNSVGRFTIFVSAESTGAQAEYSRDGMDWDLFTTNVESLLANTNEVIVSFMSAFNILSLPTLSNYIRYVRKLKRTYRHSRRIKIDFAYVRHPEFLDIKIASKELIEKYLTPAIKYMQMGEYDDWETKKLVRIYEDCESRFNNLLSESVATDKYRFYQFTKQYDARRGKNFTEVFPEFKDFLKEYEDK